MAGIDASKLELRFEVTRDASSSQRCRMPLWEAPEAWLQLLVNREDFITDLPKLMSVNWSMCEATLRSTNRWRLVIKVCASADADIAKTGSPLLRSQAVLRSQHDCSRRRSTPLVSWHGCVGRWAFLLH
jgi:hypothetical protein